MAVPFNRIMFQVLIRPTSLPRMRETVRLYSRWMHRTPSKVALPFDSESKSNLKKEKVINLDPNIFNKQLKAEAQVENATKVKSKPTFSPEKSSEIKQQKEEKLKKQKFYLSQQKVFDDNGDIIYEKLKENDPRISTLLVKLKTKKERTRSSQTLVEGWRLILDGLEAKCSLKYIIFSRSDDLNKLRPFLPKTGVKCYKIPYKQLQLWSDVETSPGIFGVFQTPTAENVKVLSRPLPLHLICDNIRVPGNLGAILRVAVGAGCEKVLLTKGCVDLWDPKVIRSAAGAHFRLPIYHSIEWSDMPSYLEKNTSIFIADSNVSMEFDVEESNRLGHNNLPVCPYYSIDFSSMNHTTIILGGETEGISEESYLLAADRNGLRINIPLQKGVDSLNTGMALAVIAFEIRKQLLQMWNKNKLEREKAQIV